MSHDETGFAEFFQASWDPCLRAVATSTGDMLLAEDQVAEAFAWAWASWRKVSRHPAPRARVVRTALNAGASWWRRRGRELPLADHDVAAPDAAAKRSSLIDGGATGRRPYVQPDLSSYRTVRRAALARAVWHFTAPGLIPMAEATCRSERSR